MQRGGPWSPPSAPPGPGGGGVGLSTTAGSSLPSPSETDSVWSSHTDEVGVIKPASIMLQSQRTGTQDLGLLVFPMMEVTSVAFVSHKRRE